VARKSLQSHSEVNFLLPMTVEETIYVQFD